MRRLWLWLALGLTLLVGANASAAPPQDVRTRSPAEYVPGRILVQLRTKDLKTADTLAAAVQGKVALTLPALGIVAVDVPNATTETALKTLAARPDVAFAERDPIIHLSRPAGGWRPNDPLFDQQWALTRLGVPDAWDLTRGDPSIVVAVLDTGMDFEHPDLQGQTVAGWDFVRKGPTPQDDNGHGTHVSGIIGAAANNGLGLSGVAPGSRVMPIKVVTAAGIGSHGVIAQGIEHAVRNRARILNLSLGGTEPSETLRRAIEYAWDNGLLIVAAAGNENSDTAVYPAAWPNVVGVGATNVDDSRAPFSNYGNDVTVVAPGVAVLSTIMGGGYEAWPGTSMATPLVSGVAALLWSRYPTLSNTEVRDLLLRTTERIGTDLYDVNGRSPAFGYGQVNAARAVGLTIVTPTPQPNRPTVTPTPCPLPDLKPEEQAMFNAINAARISEGVPPLSLDMRLMGAARSHSQDMADHARLQHNGTDGSTPQDRIGRAGYPFADVSQLIAGDEGNAQVLVRYWLNSNQGHREILLAPWDDVGIGFVVAPTTPYFYYWTVNVASRLPNAPLATPVRPVCATGPAVTRTSTPRPPTITPTPTATPLGLIYTELRPAPRAVGWVRSDQPNFGNWGDDDTYTGSLGGLQFHGAVQFNLSGIPANASIQRAQLRLTGQDATNRRAGGQWKVQLLGADADVGWTAHGYAVVDGVSVVDTVGTVEAGEIGEGKTNVFDFAVTDILELQQRLTTTGLVSFRFDGPMTGDNLFSWDSGQGVDSTQPGPVLQIAYVLNGPPPTPGTPTPTPTVTPSPLPPTIVPTPTPDANGAITLQIAARPPDVGWTVSSENRGNHLGDDDIYVGVYDDARYLGAVQLDLSALPPNAQLNWATLFFLGRSRRYTLADGDFRVSLLESTSDLAWSSLTYTRLVNAFPKLTLAPTLRGVDLQAGQPYFYQFSPAALAELQTRVATTRRLSLRLEGPSSGPSNLFSWNAAAEGAPPVLTVNYRALPSGAAKVGATDQR